MNKFDQKLSRWDRMQELTEKVQYEVQDMLAPVLCQFRTRIGQIEDVRRDSKFVTVRTVEYFRGESFSEEINIPYEVWNAEDPVDAATKYLEAKRATEAEAKRVSIQNEIDRLQQQLKAK